MQLARNLNAELGLSPVAWRVDRCPGLVLRLTGLTPGGSAVLFYGTAVAPAPRSLGGGRCAGTTVMVSGGVTHALGEGGPFHGCLGSGSPT